nr:retrovirus-related Pol polyprotein from transposon TNT 1-94 [Tanacetum cinerariifolium]
MKRRKAKRSEGCWSDSEEEDDSKKDEICLMAHENNKVRLKLKLESDKWIKDSGCSRHMAGNKDLFSTYEAINRGNVVFGINTKSKIIDKASRTPQSNGVVEFKSRTLQEMSRTMLNEQFIPQKFWCNVVDTSTYILNRILIRHFLGKTPYELFKGKKPSLEYFKVFGSKCFILNTKDYFTKFDPKSTEGVFLGYSPNSKAYIILNKETMRIEESLNVIFKESPHPKSSPLVDDDIIESQIIEKQIEYIEDKENRLLNNEIINIKESKNHPLEMVIEKLNERTLRSQVQNQSNFLCSVSSIEPKNVKEAIKDES